MLAIRTAAQLLSPAGRRAALTVLIFHRVLPQPDSLLPELPDVAAFDWQMRTLARGFVPLPLADGIRRLADGSLPARACCVTFDDGYADNLHCALPVLQRHGIPATLFVATGFLDGGRMFNDTVIEALRRAPGPAIDLTGAGLSVYEIPDTAARRRAIDDILARIKYQEPDERDRTVAAIARACGTALPDDLMLTTDGLRQAHRGGFEIGGHTRHHPILARTEPQAARDEITGGKRRLEEILQAPVRLFAYPNGRPETDYRAEHVAMVREAGFEAAVSTAWGVARAGADPFQVPRFTPWDRTPSRYGLRLVQNLLRRSYATV